MNKTEHLPDSGFGKIFQTTYTGSLMGSGAVVMAVWPYVIANARPPGVVELVPRYMAVVIGCDVAEILKAIEFLQTPDPESRTPIEEGRRLIHLNGHMYSVPTWANYREKRDEVARKAYFREAKRSARQAAKEAKEMSKTCPRMSKNVQDCPTMSNLSTQAEAEAEADKKKERPPALSIPLERTTQQKTKSERASDGMDLHAIMRKINTLRPEWQKPAQWASSEMHDLHGGAAGQICELDEQDWEDLTRYMTTILPKEAGFWQPRSRTKFVQSFADVFQSLQRWREKTQPQNKQKSIYD